VFIGFLGDAFLPLTDELIDPDFLLTNVLGE
jgi:hypothetical protein